MSVFYRTNEMRIVQFLTEAEEIYYDESFQRPAGCWTDRNHNGYIEDVFYGINSTPIVVAEIEKCRRHAEKRHDEASEAYFAKHSKRGMSYISLDGQHRAICIEQFLNNKITFTGTAIDDNGRSIKVKNRFFKDLDQSFQDCFKNKTIVFQQYERASRSSLPRVFKGLNSNSGLTDQQKRNATQTPFASWIREVCNNHKICFSEIFAKNAFQKMTVHETVSKLFMHIENKSCNVGRRSLDDYYEKGVDDKFENNYSVPARKKTESILNSLTFLVNSKNREKLGNNQLLALFLVLDKLHDDSEFNIEDFLADEFLEMIRIADITLVIESEEQKVLDRKQRLEKTESSYYHEKKRLNWAGQVRKERQEMLYNKFLKTIAEFSEQAAK